MCPPIPIGVAVAISVATTVASGVMSAVQQNSAAKARYAGKVQAQRVATEQARADRDANQQQLIAQRTAAEREFSANQMESTLAAESLRGKALAQNSTTNVSSAVFDQFDRQTYMQEQQNQTSNIWNLQQNARNLQASSESTWRKEEARIWKNRAGAPPANTMGMDLAITAMKGASAGLSTYGAAGGFKQ